MRCRVQMWIIHVPQERLQAALASKQRAEEQAFELQRHLAQAQQQDTQLRQRLSALDTELQDALAAVKVAPDQGATSYDVDAAAHADTQQHAQESAKDGGGSLRDQVQQLRQRLQRAEGAQRSLQQELARAQEEAQRAGVLQERCNELKVRLAQATQEKVEALLKAAGAGAV